MIVGEQYFCVSDDSTYKIVKVDKSNLSIVCLDCVSSKEPFLISKIDLQKLINTGRFKLSKEVVLIPIVEQPKTEITEVKEKEVKKPLPEYKPKPKDIDLFS